MATGIYLKERGHYENVIGVLFNLWRYLLCIPPYPHFSFGILAFITLAISAVVLMGAGAKEIYELPDDSRPNLLEPVSNPTGNFFLSLGGYVASIAAASLGLFCFLYFVKLLPGVLIMSVFPVMLPLLLAVILVGTALMIGGYAYSRYEAAFSAKALSQKSLLKEDVNAQATIKRKGYSFTCVPVEITEKDKANAKAYHPRSSNFKEDDYIPENITPPKNIVCSML